MRRRRADRAQEYERPAFHELLARLGANLRQLRADLGWTQEQAAERAELATPLYQRVESGATNATLITISKLSSGFGVDVVRLFAPLPHPPARRRRRAATGDIASVGPRRSGRARGAVPRST